MPRSGVAVFDLDGTITRSDTYIGFLVVLLRRNPLRCIRAAWLPFAVTMHFLGMRDNTWLKRVFLTSIAAGLDKHQIESSAQAFVGAVLARGVRPGALSQLREHQARGDRVVLASASFDFYVREFASRLSIDEVICTSADWRNGQLLGTFSGGNCYGPEKLKRVVNLLGIERDTWNVIAYSDHHSDLDLLEWADAGIAVNPTQTLRRLCGVRGLAVVNW